MTLATEGRNPNSRDIDRMSSQDIARVINAEDAKVALAVQQALPPIAEAIDAIAAALAGGGRLFYIGAGSSGRLGVLDAAECPPTFSTPPELVQGIIAGGEPALTRAVEGAEDSPNQAAVDLAARRLSRADIVCGIAASGRTPYVLGALRYARRIGAPTIAIACNHNSPLGEIADISISVELGPEVIAGSTRMKAGSAQKMILNMLSSGAMIRLGKVYGNLMVDVNVSNQKLHERAWRLVQQLTGLGESECKALLTRAGNDVKVAVTMGRLGIEAEPARHALNEADGRLRAVIGG